jgi:hypothetical protein
MGRFLIKEAYTTWRGLSVAGRIGTPNACCRFVHMKSRRRRRRAQAGGRGGKAAEGSGSALNTRNTHEVRLHPDSFFGEETLSHF